VSSASSDPARSDLASSDLGARHASVDVLRGAVAVLMVFGWHLSTLPDAPAVWKHLAAPTDEGLTIADAVFPAFLFLVGLSTPLAEAAQRRAGASLRRVLQRAAVRALALLAIGVLMVNAPLVAAPFGWQGAPWRLWSAVVLAAVLAVWNRNPLRTERAERLASAARAVGFVALGAAALTYRRADGGWLRPEWWGILGVIGWVSLPVAAVSAVTRGRRGPIVLALFAALGVYCAAASPDGATRARVFGFDFGSIFGTHTAIALAGLFVGTLLAGPTQVRDATRRLWTAAAWLAGVAALGAALAPAFGVNKLRATPAWGLYAAALTGGAWLAAALLYDGGRVRAPLWLRRIGENPLAVYLIYQLALDVLMLTGRTEVFTLGHRGPVLAVLTSLAFAAAVGALAALARRYGPWPRL